MFVINCLSTLIYDNNYYPLISAKHKRKESNCKWRNVYV